MKATLIFRLNHELDDGSLIEMVIWKVPERIPGSHHGLKYRLYFGKGGRRLVAYDNERGKGDHRHVRSHIDSHPRTGSLPTSWPTWRK
jgi:Family of unknown function (DUF6516)